MAKLRGRGYAAVNYPTGMNLGGDPSQALIHATTTGSFVITLSSVDLGQGIKTVGAQIAAETLGVPYDSVTTKFPVVVEWISAWDGSPPRFMPVG